MWSRIELRSARLYTQVPKSRDFLLERGTTLATGHIGYQLEVPFLAAEKCCSPDFVCPEKHNATLLLLHWCLQLPGCQWLRLLSRQQLMPGFETGTVNLVGYRYIGNQSALTLHLGKKRRRWRVSDCICASCYVEYTLPKHVSLNIGLTGPFLAL